MADVAHTHDPAVEPVERSRTRRRRRIQIRRNNDDPADGGDALPSGQDESGSGSTVVGIPVPPAACFSWVPGNGGGLVIRESVPRFAPPQVPVVGAVSIAGRQRLMEDAVAVKSNLCSPFINHFRPIHYFGVFDGHGGSHFAIMCKNNLHTILKEELMGEAAEGETAPSGMFSDESVLQETWRIVINRVFSRTETVAINTCSCGSAAGSECSCPQGDVAFTGTTAVAVVLTEKHIVTGNCGDSRAVLYRARRVIPLTFDHKPDRADEKARIQASGGRVINADTARVQGILAMSRAIGDMYLKPYVISEPDVTFTRRDEDDEFLIIATDGMWDVMTAEMAGRVVRQCLKERARGNNSGQAENERCTRSAKAASLLTRLAVARRSSDNISVVVVDLKRGVTINNN